MTDGGSETIAARGWRSLDSLRSLGMTRDSLLGMTRDCLRSLGMTNLVIPSEVEESRQLARDDSI